MKEFENRLKDLRVEHGLTQEEVSEKIYVTKQAVSKWEKGLSMPDVESLGALANLYNTTVDYLLTGDEKVKIEVVKEIETVEVEVEKPISKETMKALYYHYKQWSTFTYGGPIVGVFYMLGGVVFLILANSRANDIQLIPLIVGIMFLIVGALVLSVSVFYGRKKVKQIKDEIKQKTGKDAESLKLKKINKKEQEK